MTTLGRDFGDRDIGTYKYDYAVHMTLLKWIQDTSTIDENKIDQQTFIHCDS